MLRNLSIAKEAADFISDRIGIDLDPKEKEPGFSGSWGWIDVDLDVNFDPGTNEIGDETLALRLTVEMFGKEVFQESVQADSGYIIKEVKSWF